ncbi:MAG: hypothetical protein IPJ17_21490 [Holophagales bacterium]|nr:MAG: hypothetical protein IPJ17_21490 [Holophagales bacterium]
MSSTHAATADITLVEAVLHGEGREVFADQAHWSEASGQSFRAAGVSHRVDRRGHRHRPLTEHQGAVNRS